MPEQYDSIVMGGGFFGMYIAEHLAKAGNKVLLCEKEADFMQHASYVNQARVHNGYHYPRSILTALRSRVSFPRFTREFADCIDDDFEKYYMVGRLLSNVTARQFQQFCQRIGARCDTAPSEIVRLTNPNLIEAVFSTVEYMFDAVKLKQKMLNRLHDAKVTISLQTQVTGINRVDNGLYVTMQTAAAQQQQTDICLCQQVFNCTYSMINQVLDTSGIELIPFKHELTELCLVEVPELLKDKGVTVMCGPFFSVTPFPSRQLHSFSHVRYTPHFDWYDRPGAAYLDSHKYINNINKQSDWKKMQYDAKRYIPVLEQCVYRESLWEVKTVLPRSEADDSRPILYKRDYGLPGLHCIMGGKIDNVYDVVDEINTPAMH